MNPRSPPARPRSGTRNPVVQLAELFAQGDIERAREIYNKSIVPLSRDDARRYLTSSDDALVLILNMMQTGTSNSNSEAVNRIHQCGWTLLWKALGARRLDDEQRVSPDKRLYIRLLLRHIDLLCSSGLDLLNHVNTLFGAWCKDAERLEQNWLQRIHAMHGVGDVTLSLLSLLVLLLTETHKERDARSVACMLGCLRNFYHIAATLVSMENDPRVGLLQKMFGSFHLCWQIAPVIIERVVAALPPECLDDDIARILVPYAYCVPKRAAEYCEMNCIRPENAVLWFLREVLCLEVAFNKDYVHAMIDDAAPVCDPTCVCVCGKGQICGCVRPVGGGGVFILLVCLVFFLPNHGLVCAR